jgi:pyrroline-5-carboxylate reductase
MKPLLVIGAGRMGGALVESVLRSGYLSPSDIIICEKDPAAVGRMKGLGLRIADRPSDAYPCGLVLLAVKPQGIQEVLDLLRDLPADTPVASIIAGLSISSLRAALGSDRPIARIMPNINALAGASMNSIAFSEGFPSTVRESVLGLLNATGEAIEVEEKKMDAATALAGSGPAFTAEFIAGLVDGGIKSGLTAVEAFRMALCTVEGTVQTLRGQDWDPEELKRAVSSPAGTTIEGLFVLGRRGMRASVMEAVEAACQRAVRLGEKK